MIRYDLRPPPWSTGKISATPASRAKNPLRQVSDQFTEPVCLAEWRGRLGHYHNGQFWDQTAGRPVATADGVIVHGGADATIPSGAVAETSVDTFKLYDFALPATAPPVLAVWSPSSSAVDDLEAVEAMDAPWVPCARFLELAKDGHVRFYRVADRKQFLSIAQSLCVQGWLVSAPTVDGAHPVHSIQLSLLRWVKDTDAEHALSKFADSMPGIACGAGRGYVPPAAAPTLLGMVYDHDMNVPRSMMSWGALGARMAKAGGPLPADTCEPLKSYIHGVITVQSSRNRQGGAVASTDALLQWNMPQRMSKEQVAHAAALYYWAAIYVADKAPLAAGVARQALELYLRFGAVVLRKRAYQFKRHRDVVHEEADAEEEE